MYLKSFSFLIVLFCLPLPMIMAGDIDSQGTKPSDGSGIYSLNDLYDYLVKGKAASIPDTFQAPLAGPASSSKTTKDIYDDIKDRFDVCNAGPGDVLSGVTFFSTDAADRGPVSGVRYPGGKIVLQTGQTAILPVDPPVSGSDGDLRKGVIWPIPRFTDNNDGTVTDNLTHLVWLKRADCFNWGSWEKGIDDCKTLADGSCGLTDNSSPGDWRLPNIRELESLVDYGYANPALSDTAGTGKWTEGNPFSGVKSYVYMSSTIRKNAESFSLYLPLGRLSYTHSKGYVWPVRDQ